jgi:hypothetical protein
VNVTEEVGGELVVLGGDRSEARELAEPDARCWFLLIITNHSELVGSGRLQPDE